MNILDFDFTYWGSVDWKGVEFLYDDKDWLSKELIKGTKTHRYKVIWIDINTGEKTILPMHNNLLDCYNENGDLIKRLMYNDNDDIIATIKLSYDSMGNLIFHETYGHYYRSMRSAHLLYTSNHHIGSVFNYDNSSYNIQLKRSYGDEITEAYMERLNGWQKIESRELLKMKYNDDYLLIEQTTLRDYQSSSQSKSKYLYKYDEEKRLIKAIYQNSQGKTTGGAICNYNGRNKEIKRFSNQKRLIDKYYKDGLIVRELIYNDDDELDKEIVYEYENSNLKEKITTSHTNGWEGDKKRITKYINEYDEYGQLNETFIYEDGELEHREKYFYDKKGRRIEHIRFSSYEGNYEISMKSVSIYEDF